MQNIIPRTIVTHMEEQLSRFPILAVTGPRQSGKTTLLRHTFPRYQYVSLENPDNRSFATEDPVGFLNEYPTHTILDEVQHVPTLFSYLQTRVDESEKTGQYILSGSQNFHLLKNITQTLAGRVALFRLLPFDMQELMSVNLLPETYPDACIKGFYPPLYKRKINPFVFYANYIQTYIEKDVTELINIHSKQSFRNFLGLCAARSGQPLNMNGLANDCGISQPTAKAWLSILESSYIIHLLYPYHENFNKRLVKAPKLFFYDTGLLCFLLGVREPGELLVNRLKGNIFENLIVTEFLKRNEHQYTHLQYYFWQDFKGHEVDLLLKTSQGFESYEIKATETISSGLFKGLERFAAIAASYNVNKNLVYGGTKNLTRSGVRVYGWQSVTPGSAPL